MTQSLQIDELFAPNDDGWLLHMRRTVCEDTLDVAREPVVLIPGYGMNTHILQWHPRGTSFEATLARAGFEVWSANLRFQGPSRPVTPRPSAPSLRGFAEVDVSAVVRTALAHTHSNARKVHLIGCSLGGTIAYAHLALCPNHCVASVVAIGAPLRWVSRHPLLMTLFASPRLVGLVPVLGSRAAARAVFPVLAKAPQLLSVYLNPDHCDIDAIGELTKSIDDPHRAINREIARWMRARDLTIRDVNISQAVAKVDVPLCLVVANRDGIVPTDVALSARERWGGPTHVINVGDDHDWYAHADLFIGNTADRDVVQPIGEWLTSHG